MKYETAYFCGMAKVASSMATTTSNGSLNLGMLIELETGRVLDVSVTLITKLAQESVRSYFVGKRIIEDYDSMVEEATYRHVGIAVKPILKALADIRRNYEEYMNENGAFLRGETNISTRKL